MSVTPQHDVSRVQPDESPIQPSEEALESRPVTPPRAAKHILKEGEELEENRIHMIGRIPVKNKKDGEDPPPVEENTCRICFDVETFDHLLISPCKCSGSSKFIHEECLKAWLVSQENVELSQAACEICKTPLKMEFIVRKKCSPRDAFRDGIAQCLFVPLLVGVLVMLLLIIYLLCDEHLDSESSDEEEGYTIAIMVTCVVSSLVIILLIFNSIKDACFARKLLEWRIYTQRFNEEVHQEQGEMQEVPPEANESKIDPTNVGGEERRPANRSLTSHTVLRQAPVDPEASREEAVLPPLLVIPKKAMYKGKRIKLPTIKPGTMNVVLTQGRGVAMTPKPTIYNHSNGATPIRYSVLSDHAEMNPRSVSAAILYHYAHRASPMLNPSRSFTDMQTLLAQENRKASPEDYM